VLSGSCTYRLYIYDRLAYRAALWWYIVVVQTETLSPNSANGRGCESEQNVRVMHYRVDVSH